MCKKTLCVRVTNISNTCIYGRDWIHAFTPDFSVNLMSGAKVSLQLKENSTPIFMYMKPRPIPYGLRDAVKAELDKLVSDIVTDTAVQESDWATSIVLVIRICGDYKVTLNPRLMDMVSATPTVDDMINSTPKSSLFTKIDLANV